MCVLQPVHVYYGCVSTVGMCVLWVCVYCGYVCTVGMCVLWVCVCTVGMCALWASVRTGHWEPFSGIPKTRLLSDGLEYQGPGDRLVHVTLGTEGNDVGHPRILDLPLQQATQLLQLLLHFASKLRYQCLQQGGRFRWRVDLQREWVTKNYHALAIEPM